jgi:hypothetical protein
MRITQKRQNAKRLTFGGISVRIRGGFPEGQQPKLGQTTSYGDALEDSLSGVLATP